jgi:glycerate dehydrogenase
MVFALLLELTNHVQIHSDAVGAGEWSQCPDFCFWKIPQVELAGKTLGVVGFGNIGRQVARIGAAIGMRVIASDVARGNPPELEGFRWAEVPELLAKADVVSLHCPLTPETEAMIDRRSIGLMKRSAFLINTSRGGLVVDADLADALNDGRIGGAGLDVVSTEPPAPDNPLLSAKNCLITPHIAWASQESRARLLEAATRNLEGFLAGKPVNVVTK